MVLLRIFVGCGDVKDAGTPSSSTSLCLSAANEAMVFVLHSLLTKMGFPLINIVPSE